MPKPDMTDPTRQITLARVPNGYLLIVTKFIDEQTMRASLDDEVKARVRQLRRKTRRAPR